MKKNVLDYKNKYCRECQNYYGEDGYGHDYSYGEHCCGYITPNGPDLCQETIDRCREEGAFCPIQF